MARVGALVALLAASALAQADFCWRDSYGRSVGTIPTDCGSGKDYDAGLCYNKCSGGYQGVGPVCWKGCPSGFTDNGVGCTKPGPYGRGGGYPWKFGDGLNDHGMFNRCESANGKGNCEKWGAVVYPKCKPGYHNVASNICSPNCPSGYADLGVSCTKPTQTRGVGTVPTSCSGGKQYDAGLCYNQCKTSYSGVGPVCWQQCGAGMVNCGAGCASSKEECSGAVRDQVMSVVEVAVTIATAVATAGASTGAEAAAGAGKAAAETGAKAATKAAANQATKAAAKGITKASATAALKDAAKGAGVNLTMQQIDQVAGVAAGDDWDPYSLDPTGVAAVVKAYNHKVCGKS
jgi:hypothetical protein